MNAQPVSSPSPGALAYEFIREEILALRMRPNERLNTIELAARLKMSRTPVREALGRLEQDGLVRREAAIGFRVHALTLKEIVDIYRIREALEVEAALEALPNLTPATLDELEKPLRASQQLLERDQYNEFILANREFHAQIVRLTRNVMLEAVMSPIVDRVRLIGAMLIQRHAARQREVLDENLAILAALRSADPARVEEAVRAHVRRAREHAANLLARDHGQLFIAAAG